MRRIARRLLDELDAIVERLGDRYREVPEYAALSDRAMRAEVLPMSRQVVATFLEALVDGREPRLEDGPDIAVIGRRRLEMGVRAAAWFRSGSYSAEQVAATYAEFALRIVNARGLPPV